MGFFDFLRVDKQEFEPFPTGTGSRIIPTAGRVSSDESGKLPFQALVRESGNRKDRTHKYVELQVKDISKMEVKDLYEILVDSDPEVGLAMNHYISFANVAHVLRAYRPNTDTEYPEAQTVLDEFSELMEVQYGGFDVLLDSMFYSIFIGGAIFNELVLDDNGRNMVDFIVLNPYEARFEKKSDPVRGPVWHKGQIINGVFVDLEKYETVSYLPYHPAPRSPYGRAPMSPVVFSCLFLISMLRDLELVIRHQGWERLDLKLNVSAMEEMAGQDPSSDEYKEFISSMITDIESAYQKLKPNDIFIHTDHWEFGESQGVSNRFNFAGIAEIIQILERRIIRALKSQPLLMGSNEAVTETHANRQWEIYAGAIRSVQGMVSTTIGRLLGLGLQGRGIVADVKLLFDEFRDSERLRDLQADNQELSNLELSQQMGWINESEAAKIASQIRKGRRRGVI